MAQSKNSFLSEFASSVNTFGKLPTSALATTPGVTVYDSIGLLPYAGNDNGNQAYVQSNNRLYIWDSVGWYNIALINTAPNISSITDSDGGTTPFALAIDGSTQTVITITAADSDGDPITYSVIKGTGFDSIATLSQDSSVFTITPFSEDSAGDATSGTLTFQATDGINVVSSALQTFTLQFVSEYWDEVVLSIGTSDSDGLDNSTFIDRSTNASTVTTSGTPTQTAFHPYLDNWSVEFDGTGDYITTTITDGLGSGDFTIEGWVYQTSLVDYISWVSSTRGSTGFNIGTDASGDVVWYDQVSSASRKIEVTNQLSTNTWYHFAFVRSNGSIQAYLDGTAIGSAYSSSANYSAEAFGIGDTIGATGEEMYGYMSNVRIVKGTAVYTADFTVPTEKLTAVTNTKLLTCQSNRFVDNSSSGHSLTANGNPEISAYNPFGQGSEYDVGENKGSYYNVTNGTDNAYVAPHTSKVLVYDEDWTIEFWCYADTFTAQSYIIGKGILTSRQWAVGVQDAKLRFYYSTNGASSGDTTKDVSYDFKTGTWYHIALVNDGSTNTLTYYVNGTSAGTQNLGAFYSSNGYGEYIGKFMNYGAADHAFDGYISDLRICNGNKIYTSAFTPPTSPVGNTNADLYLPMDNAGIFDKAGNNALTLFGGTSTSTTQTKFADTAMYFDGSGDYILAGANDFYDKDFTIEFWWYPTSTSRQALMHGSWGNDWSIGIDYSSTSSNQKIGIWASSNGSSWNLINSDNGGNGIGSETINQNAWNHIAYTRSGTTWRLFVNGVLDVELTGISGSIARPTQQIAIGVWWSTGQMSQVNGYLENFQILKGAAKYTANFTAPTQEQGRTYQATS